MKSAATPKHSWRLMLVVVLVAGSSLAVHFSAVGKTKSADTWATPEPVSVKSTSELKKLFSRYDYQWPLAGKTQVPAIMLNRIPSDFPTINSVKQKKALFFRLLLPVVLVENQSLNSDRQRLLGIMSKKTKGQKIDKLDQQWLAKMTSHYRLDKHPNQNKELVKRMDEVPTAMVIAQAVIETGWGTSRFALQGNSLFGQWTYKKENGLVPAKRNNNAKHFVRAFPDLRGSVRAYLRNLNTSRAYREFRQMRAELRQANKPLDPNKLAAGLTRYSQLGETYVGYVRKIIRVNGLQKLNQVSLAQ